MSDRDVILGRVRGALGDVPADEAAHWQPIEPGNSPQPADLVARFAERCDDYRATVTRCSATTEAIALEVARACQRHGVATLATPVDIDPTWIPTFVEARPDAPALTPAQLGACDGVLTGSALAIAETGTIVLDAGVGQGRRALTLVPDLHICLVPAERIVASVPDAMAALAGAIGAGQPVTLISGPSATSDIELRRVEGVHGPRRLEVIVAGS